MRRALIFFLMGVPPAEKREIVLIRCVSVFKMLQILIKVELPRLLELFLVLSFFRRFDLLRFPLRRLRDMRLILFVQEFLQRLSEVGMVGVYPMVPIAKRLALWG